MKHDRHLWPVLYAILLVAFTLYMTLDTFVIKDVYQADATAVNTSLFEESNASSSAASSSESEETQSETASSTAEESSSASEDLTQAWADGTVIGTYSDDNVTITLYQFEENDTAVYAADVQVSSAEYLKTAFAEGTYGKNVTETTSAIAEENDAILAINGDFYGAQESGIVIRNGVLYRDEAASGTDVLCIYADGSFEIVDTDEVSAQDMVDNGVWQAFSFGPSLIENGEITVSSGDEVGKAMASNPRTAIGIIDNLHYVFVVSDGRTSESAGLSLSELAQFMDDLGCTTAYNLDGGGSSTMYFQGEVINNPTTNGNQIQERSVSDIVYIGKQ
ncbi:MAG: phosphodiester glycosidase family protein [Lachnospiraceae bacterium]|jgi:exopolysaccharide biosynthesis protein